MEIDPNNLKELKDNKIADIIDGRDLVEYELTDKSPSVIGKDSKHKAGEKHWGHPNVVAKFTKHGWAKLTGEKKEFKMPDPVKKR